MHLKRLIQPDLSRHRALAFQVDKLAAKFPLQLLHALVQRRLRGVAHLRSTREVQRARNG